MTQIVKQEHALRTQEDLKQVAALFSRNLLQNSKALEYLKERGLPIEMVKQGLIGFCPPYYDHWFDLIRGRITVPIRDVHGRIVAFAGRQFEPMADITERAFWDSYGRDPARAQKRFEKWKRGKWLNEVGFSKSRHLYFLDKAKEAARERNYIVLVEGYFDTLVLTNNDFPNTAAVCGLALTEYHVATIKRYCDHVVFILDPDDAGMRSLAKMREIAEEGRLKHHSVFLPNKLDPDEFILKYGSRALKSSIDKMILNDTTELVVKLRNENKD
jgi:DNA primase